LISSKNRIARKLILTGAFFICFSLFIDCKPNSTENRNISTIITEKSFADGECTRIQHAIKCEIFLFGLKSRTDVEFDCFIEKKSPQWVVALSFLKKNYLKKLFFVSDVAGLLLNSELLHYQYGIDQWGYAFTNSDISPKEIIPDPVNDKSGQFSEVSIWLRGLCIVLFWLLRAIFFIIPYWGVAIILLALVVRLLLYPLASKALKSQQIYIEAQKRLLPELKEIKTKYKGGEQSEKILELYKKHNVSPFAGLKPLLIVLIQLPILIALYKVLGSAEELQGASFLWIDSLALPDQLFNMGFDIPLLGSYFNLLPLIMTVFTLLSFKLSPAPATDKRNAASQKIYMVVMALSFFLLFYSFPAGMVLYWTFANIFQLIQQQLILHFCKQEKEIQ